MRTVNVECTSEVLLRGLFNIPMHFFKSLNNYSKQAIFFFLKCYLENLLEFVELVTVNTHV